MTGDIDASTTLEGRLWRLLEQCGVGHLGLTRSGLHPQPAVVFVGPRRRQLWFAVTGESELACCVGEGAPAIFTAQAPGVLASIGGPVALVHEPARLARMWTPAAAAWRPQGPSDPAITFLRMDCVDAEVSFADLGITRFSWELAQPRFRGKKRRPLRPLYPMLH